MAVTTAERYAAQLPQSAGVSSSGISAPRAAVDRFHGHHVSLSAFEGPLDLLLYLIKSNRYDIFDIPIAEITGQYLQFLRIMELLDFELAGDFMVVASELMLIKSKMLLPPEEELETQEPDLLDPRRGLVERLLEYRRFQEAAQTLRDCHEIRARMFHRVANGDSLNGGANGHNGNGNGNGHAHGRKVLLMHDVSLFDLLAAFQRALDRTREPEPALIEREPITVGQRLRHILQQIRQAPGGLSFSDLCEDCLLRIEVIVTFLALLECIRRQRARVEQSRSFGEIRIFHAAPA